MAFTKVLADKKVLTKTLQFVTLISIAVILPLFHQQWITGPLVNAVFFLSVVLLGTQNAILLALFPSTIALSIGLLPAVLAPVIPFIIISNVIMVLAFSSLREKSFWSGIVLGSILKFAFLWATSSLVINLLLKKELAVAVTNMMAWPQLATALLGGVIAYGILKFLRKI